MEVIDKENVIENKEDYVHSFKSKKIKRKKAKIEPNKKINYVRDFVLCIALSLIVVGVSVLIIILSDGWSESLVMPIFYPSTIWLIVITCICYALITVGLVLACKQGVNKKVYILYALNAFFNILLLLCLMVFRQSMIGLFVSLFVFYFAFVLYNELKKVNKTVLYMFLPYTIWTVFEVVCCYAIVMMN